MKFGWPISILAHSLVVFGGMIMLSAPMDLDSESRVVPIELLTVEEFTNIRAAVKGTPTEQSEPMTLETPMDNAEEEGEASEAVREAELTTPQTTIDPSQAEITEDIPENTEPDKPAFSLDDMSALINRTRDSQPEKNQQRTLQSERNIYAFADMARASAGSGTAMTVSELEALQSAMYKCWRIPLDAKNPEELGVRVRVRLRPDGNVQTVDLLDEARINSSPNPFLKIAAQRAVSAVSKCAPYDFLPQEKYSMWQDMTLNFVPEV